MRRIKRTSWAIATGCLLILLSSAAGQDKRAKTVETTAANPSQSVEERLVRMAYKKLEVYNFASSLQHGLPPREISAGDKSLKFELTNFKVGKIDEIKNVPYKDRVDLLTGEIIQLGFQRFEFNDEEQGIAYRANWAPGQYVAMFDRNWTIGDLLRFEADKYYDVTAYASYDVTVSLEKKKRSYSALVLFKGPLEDFRLEVWDSITGMGGTLTQIWEQQEIPYGASRRQEVSTRSIGREHFVGRVRDYLRKSGAKRISHGAAIDCSTASDGECCIDPGLADFWGIDACKAGRKDVSQFVGDTDGPLPEQQDIQFYSQDDTGHISGTGVHHGRARFRPTCTPIADNRQRCNIEIRDQGYGDNEENHSDVYYHRGAIAEDSRGSEGPRGRSIECDAAVGFAFDACLFSSCNVNITMSLSGRGMGVSATVTGGNLWRAVHAQGNVCNIPFTPTTSPGGCNQSAEFGCMPGFVAVNGMCTRSLAFMSQCARFGDYDFEACTCTGGCSNNLCSPIVVDVLGNGFNMTSASTGVFFDIEGRGTADRLAWTSANSDDAWLALDRNNNGTIDNGKELFGNITGQDIHPEGVERNGFLALALYDSPAYGGNADGYITAADNIFSKLKLWRDDNHNGVSEDCELFTLPDLGLSKIDLDYKSANRTDEHGNQFKYRSKAHDRQDTNIGRWAWDVFLVRQP